MTIRRKSGRNLARSLLAGRLPARRLLAGRLLIVYNFPMQVIDRNHPIWNFLSPEQRGLIQDGELLMEQAEKTPRKVSDYSYLVFSFAKMYEGFLKKLFLDLEIIDEQDYYGDDIRIGKLLNPFYVDITSVYEKLCQNRKVGKELAEKLWTVWRKSRNQVFHYYPHNFRRLDYNEALEYIYEIIEAVYAVGKKCLR